MPRTVVGWVLAVVVALLLVAMLAWARGRPSWRTPYLTPPASTAVVDDAVLWAQGP